MNHLNYNLSATNIRVRLGYHYDPESGEVEWRLAVQNADFFWVLKPDGSLERRMIDDFEVRSLHTRTVEQPDTTREQQDVSATQS